MDRYTILLRYAKPCSEGRPKTLREFPIKADTLLGRNPVVSHKAHVQPAPPGLICQLDPGYSQIMREAQLAHKHIRRRTTPLLRSILIMPQTNCLAVSTFTHLHKPTPISLPVPPGPQMIPTHRQITKVPLTLQFLQTRRDLERTSQIRRRPVPADQAITHTA